jgi:cell division protein FtsI (penicillin-binding protein 3)
LRARLADTRREFVYLKRQLPPDQAERVVQLGIPGVFLQREHRRYYPAGEVMSHIIGFTGVDDRGQEALELAFEETLAGNPGSRRVIKDRLGRIVEDVESIRVPQNGQQLRLSIDARIQYLAFRELRSRWRRTARRPAASSCLTLPLAKSWRWRTCRRTTPTTAASLMRSACATAPVTDLFEPGSTLKPFTAAAALEAGLFKPGTVIQTAPGQLTIGSRTIRDAHPQGALTVAQVIQKSSNVGTAKMGWQCPRKCYGSLFSRVGFGAPPRSGFRERSRDGCVRTTPGGRSSRRRCPMATAFRCRCCSWRALHHIRFRWRALSGDTAQARWAGAGHPGHFRADRARGAADA